MSLKSIIQHPKFATILATIAGRGALEIFAQRADLKPQCDMQQSPPDVTGPAI